MPMRCVECKSTVGIARPPSRAMGTYTLRVNDNHSTSITAEAAGIADHPYLSDGVSPQNELRSCHRLNSDARLNYEPYILTSPPNALSHSCIQTDGSLQLIDLSCPSDETGGHHKRGKSESSTNFGNSRTPNMHTMITTFFSSQ